MFVDHTRRHTWDQIRRRGLRAFAPILTDRVLAQAARRAGVALGGGPLCLAVLAWLAIACALHPGRSFAAVLGLAFKLIRLDPRWDPDPPSGAARRRPRRRARRHDPRGGGDPTRVSPAAFAQARRAMPWRLWVALVLVLAERHQRRDPAAVSAHGFRLLALDGTALELDRWRDRRRRAGAAANGKALSSPRARLVLLQLPLARLPLRCDLVPYAVGERTAALPLLEAVRRDDLVLIDRGFWGAGLFARILARRAAFAIRLIDGVSFTATRRLGPQDRLATWTPTRAHRAAGEAAPAAFRLRLIGYQVRGFRPSTLVTSVLDPARISRRDWIRIATAEAAGRVLEPGLYHRRWEVETTSAELKVTQGMAGSFRSRTAEGIAFEVAGHLLPYTLVRLLMAEAAGRAGVSPLRLSFKAALEEVRDTGPGLLRAGRRHAAGVLRPRLVEAIGARRVPPRPGRHYPRPHDTRPKVDKRGRRQPAHKRVRGLRALVMARGGGDGEDGSGPAAAG